MLRFFVIFVILAIGLPATVSAQAVLRVVPPDGLIDEPLEIVVSNLRPAERVRIVAISPLDDHHELIAFGEFSADADGRVNVTRQASLGGTYEGIDGMGLLTSPRMEETSGASGTFAPPQPYTVQIRVESDGRIVAKAVVTRRFVSTTVETISVNEGGLFGRYFMPEGSGRQGAVLVLSGSEGGITSSQINAALYASHGYPAFALAYFKAPGMNDELIEIPIEIVKRGIEWLRRRPEIAPDRIVVSGGSKGAELALVAASEFSEIHGVVAYAPTFVVWPGIRRNGKTDSLSSWTLNGKPLPFVPHVANPEFTIQFQHPPPYALRPLYEGSLADTAAVSRASIPVERIHGPVLLISGKQDRMIPSDAMAQKLIARLQARKHPYRFEHFSYDSAGHQISLPYLATVPRTTTMPFSSGGTPLGYAHADVDSWQKVLEFLKTTLNPE